MTIRGQCGLPPKGGKAPALTSMGLASSRAWLVAQHRHLRTCEINSDYKSCVDAVTHQK